MDAGDIRKIREAGFIDEAREAAIVRHFRLEHERSRLMVAFGFLGAGLVAAGLILLVASNWDSIPRSARIGGGIALLLGAHAAGWRLDRNDSHPVLSALCHLLGSGLFLANIALVGQTYNLSSRPSNALLLWWLGIAPLAWILRSRAQHVLGLAVAVAWVVTEMNQSDSLLYLGGGTRQLVVLPMFGILFGAIGRLLGRCVYPEFGPPTEKCGLLMLHLGSVPFAVGAYYAWDGSHVPAPAVPAVLSAICVALWIAAAWRPAPHESRTWRNAWLGAQGVLLAFLWFVFAVARHDGPPDRSFGPHWIGTGLLFALCLLQIRVGVDRASRFWVNLALAFAGIHVVIAYIQLLGSMQTTGTLFVSAGALLIGLTVLLERQRRSLAARMQSRSDILP